MKDDLPPFAGNTYEVTYGELVAINAYAADTCKLRYEITAGPLKGNSAEVEYQWRSIDGETFVISWQENDKATVVHLDNFSREASEAFFTTSDLQFFRMQGKVRLKA